MTKQNNVGKLSNPSKEKVMRFYLIDDACNFFLLLSLLENVVYFKFRKLKIA